MMVIGMLHFLHVAVICTGSDKHEKKFFLL